MQELTDIQKKCPYCGYQDTDRISLDRHILECGRIQEATLSEIAYFMKNISTEEGEEILKSIPESAKKDFNAWAHEWQKLMISKGYIFPPLPGDKNDPILQKNIRDGKFHVGKKKEMTKDGVKKKFLELKKKCEDIESRMKECPRCHSMVFTRNGKVYCSSKCKNEARYSRENRKLPEVGKFCEICQKPINKKAGSKTCSTYCRHQLYLKNHPEKVIP